MKAKCEISEKLVDFVEGELDPREASRIAQHLVECPECRTYVRELETSLRAFKALLDAEGMNLSTDPLVDSVMSEIHKRKVSAKTRKWAVAVAAAAILVVGITSFKMRVDSRQYPGRETTRVDIDKSLTVNIVHDGIEVVDRIDGEVRTVNVRP